MENNSSASERWLLRGAPNARDLGGLPTMDGRTIRPGLLLRSGELAGITEPDAQALTKYPLRTVVDFRTDLEREQKPDRVLPGVQYVHCPIVQQAAAGLADGGDHHVQRGREAGRGAGHPLSPSRARRRRRPRCGRRSSRRR